VTPVPISAEHAGRRYPPTPPYEVTRGKIVELAAALGQADAYAGPSPDAPPTFAAVVTMPAWDAMFTDPELGLRLSRIIHSDQRFRYARPLRTGDVVTAALQIDRVRARAGSEMISCSVTVVDAEGETVLTAEATFLHSAEAAA
jgi:hypothetical protein